MDRTMTTDRITDRSWLHGLTAQVHSIISLSIPFCLPAGIGRAYYNIYILSGCLRRRNGFGTNGQNLTQTVDL